MDEEDLAEAAEARRIETNDGFAGLGSTESDIIQRRPFIDLFKAEGETMGVKLLKKMGWREGQGVGPKVRRKARLDGLEQMGNDEGQTHLFAPENSHMISFVRKNDHKGLGFAGSSKLSRDDSSHISAKSEDEEETFGTARALKKKEKKKPARGGIGIGILNDTGSDDEDPYEIRPRISYNKVVGGEKKKKPVLNTSTRPVFISKKAAMAKASLGLRKCHDGRLPLDGFVLASGSGSLSILVTSDNKYEPPKIPEGWKSKKQPTSNSQTAAYISTAEAAKASRLDPKTRASLLGEAPLPGKSVFDYLSSSARDRLVSATGKPNLPPALGEIPKGYAMSSEERQKELLAQIPKVDKDSAIAALGRGASGWMPYSDDEAKRSRYRAYLEGQAGIRDALPGRPLTMSRDEWLKELNEFAHCAQIFKPMSGMMATRFTSSNSTPASTTDANPATNSASLLSKPATKPEDPAEAAAKMGMYGPMTRSTQDFHPTRLLCKRFGVQPPAHVQPDAAGPEDGFREESSRHAYLSTDNSQGKASDLISKAAIDDLIKDYSGMNPETSVQAPTPQLKEPVVDIERNEALEAERAGEAVFKAIFGDDGDDD
jgi:G patch domain-containing protein 1